MAKKIQAYVKLQVPAGKANPSPPIGPALGQQGVNIMVFCKQFNARTQKMEAGMPIPVVITVFQDRSFTFITKTPPVTYFLKKAAGIESGAKTVGTQIVGKVTKKQVEEIIKIKRKDLNANTDEAAFRMIAGTASTRRWKSRSSMRPARCGCGVRLPPWTAARRSIPMGSVIRSRAGSSRRRAGRSTSKSVSTRNASPAVTGPATPSCGLRPCLRALRCM